MYMCCLHDHSAGLKVARRKVAVESCGQKAEESRRCQDRERKGEHSVQPRQYRVHLENHDLRMRTE